MATKRDFKTAQQRILSRPRSENRTDQELLRKTEDDGVYPSPLNVKAIRLDRIVADSGRAGRTFAQESLDALGQSLLIHGQITPIVVQYLSDDDIFVLVDGERRWRAAQKVGLSTLQAVIVGRMSATERCERQIAAALHQQAWALDERQQALEDYRAALGASEWADVASRLGLTESGIAALAGEMPEPDEPPPQDAVSHISEASQALNEALGSVKRHKGDHSDVLQALDDLEDMIDCHRSRLVGVRNHPDAHKGQPIRNLPTWG